MGPFLQDNQENRQLLTQKKQKLGGYSRGRKKMAGERLGEIIGIREELIKKACHQAMKAHSHKKQYLLEKTRGSSEAIFAFAGSWSVDDWFAPPDYFGNSQRKPFGETKVDLGMFPSLKNIVNDQTAVVNEAFVHRFQALLRTSSLATEVEKAVSDRKQVLFAGHSSGGPLAILATLWFLEKYFKPANANQATPLCVTFGSPLTGDRIFPHALQRENWARHFIHFVMRYDIVPRVMLAPFSSIGQMLQPILNFFNPKTTFLEKDTISAFFVNVMRNASSVASHAACNLMGCTNPLMETISSFIELSPYRPFGTYIFCTGNGKLVVLRNSDAILQLLFYSAQLSHEARGVEEIAFRSLKEHTNYENELQESLEMQDLVYLEHLNMIPLSSSDGSASLDVTTINAALKDLGLSTRARLCLRAAGELEKQKEKNQAKINSNKINIKDGLSAIQEYQTGCEVRKVGYYDAFKLQKEVKDFQANVKRLELAGIWDEIIEMLKQYKLPDDFEGQKEWIDLGTKYRRLVEPLDIANYYRHLKNEDTGPYLGKGRPRRYRYTQRWREYAERMPVGSSSESCFLAEVEETRTSRASFQDLKEKILRMENEVLTWISNRELEKDIFFDESTFSKWWKTLPTQHRSQSCLAGHINQ